MSTVARLAAVALGLGAGGTAGAVLFPAEVTLLLHLAKEQAFPSDETRLQEEGPVRNARVLEELGTMDEHTWAGIYRTAQHEPNELAISMEAGFTLYSHSWCGNCQRYVSAGSVLDASESTLRLRVELQEPDGTSAAWYGLDDTLHFVRWGDLSFAVAEGSMEVFCAAVSDGYTFPLIPFRYLGERKDFDYVRATRPTAKPGVPPAFEHLILDQPVSGRIVALVDWRRRPALDGTEREAYDAVYSVDVGSRKGLAVGMRLFVDGELRSGRFHGRVEHVEPESGLFQMLAFDGERERMDGCVGRVATTRHPKAESR